LMSFLHSDFSITSGKHFSATDMTRSWSIWQEFSGRNWY
jgi:hypothetical protein